jgi:hypothetical protein
MNALLLPRTRINVVRDVRSIVEQVWPLMRGGACAYASLVLIALAYKRYKTKLTLQAGSLQWKFTRDDLDDGVSSNNFAYMWEPDSTQTAERIAANVLPELHVWCGDVARQEIIDLSTGDLPRESKRILGPATRWTTELPPDYLWCSVSKIPTDARYIPDAEATKLAAKLMLATPLEELTAFWKQGGTPS